MASPRFEVRLHKAAQKEYERLDHSIVIVVDKALADIVLKG